MDGSQDITQDTEITAHGGGAEHDPRPKNRHDQSSSQTRKTDLLTSNMWRRINAGDVHVGKDDPDVGKEDQDMMSENRLTSGG